MTEIHFRVWDFLARVVHPFGIHTHIPLETWDRETGLYDLDGRICWLCPDRR